MWRPLLRVLGVGIGGCAGLLALSAAMSRMDGVDELRWAIRVDAEIGCALAVAVVLVRTPVAGRGDRRWYALTVALALATGIAVGGGLARLHYSQCVTRSTPPVPRSTVDE